ncbi:MAG: hypothetical protein FWG40_04560 [Peptococcaceae bacterium]|nr:hypothetical protein [Peptococcaceae bacterium]
MKAQFKHAFMASLYARGGVFAVIFAMFFVFIVLGSLGWLPFPAQVTAVALGGISIAVMMAANIVGDVMIARGMFLAPSAYLQALTPVPRRNTLLAGVIVMAVWDVVTTAVVIAGEVWMVMVLDGESFGGFVWETLSDSGVWISGLVGTALLVSGYLLIIMIILFCVTIRKSLFYQKPAGGVLTALTALGILYAVSLSQLVLVPFGSVSRFGLLININLGGMGMVVYALLILSEVVALFVLTSKLMERKMNL